MRLRVRVSKAVRRRAGRVLRGAARRIDPQPARSKKAAAQRVPAPPQPPPAAKEAAAQQAAPKPAAPKPAWNPNREERLELRRAHALAGIDPRGRFLEIGPSHNPVLPRRDGFDTRIVDHLDRAGLVEKYARFATYDPEVIEDVDYVVLDGQGLSETVPDRFDLVLASHVLEHTTSLVHFLRECSALLAPGGVLALVVPDHRYCFDRFRERSSLARVVDTYYAPPPRHTPGTMAETTLHAVSHRGTTSWVQHHRGDYAFVHPAADAAVAMQAAVGAGEYVDAHNWVFTPNHLRLLVEDLYTLGLLDLRESHFAQTVGHEFFLNLRAHGPGPGVTREELVTLADDERRVDEPTWAAPAPPAPLVSLDVTDTVTGTVTERSEATASDRS